MVAFLVKVAQAVITLAEQQDTNREELQLTEQNVTYTNH